jgi:hypothetical protein
MDRDAGSRRSAATPIGVAVSLAVSAAFVTAACASSGAGRLPPPIEGDAATTLDAGPSQDASVAPPIAEIPCNDDAPCDDGFACTDDRCDLALGRCVRVARDERCDDGVYCNGAEICSLRRGCIPGGDVCGLGNACFIARCLESERRCTTAPRDVDGDGDPDDHCGGGDCNDADPRRSSRQSEVCGNAIDDNCNGTVDEPPCVNPEGDRCEAPVVLPAEGERVLTTAGATAAPPSGCAVPIAASSRTVFVAVPHRTDADTVLEVIDLAAPVTLARLAACGQPAIACEQAALVPFPRVRLPAAPGAGSHLVAVTTTVESTLRVRTARLPAGSTEGTRTCANPEPLVPGVRTRVDFTTLGATLPTDCAATGLRTFRLDVPAEASLTLEAASPTGRGAGAVGLRSASCADRVDEIACRNTDVGPLIVPSLPAGTYVVTVATTTAPALEVLATLGAPSAPPPGSSCLLPVVVAPGQRVTAPLDDRADFVRSGCTTGGSAAAFRVDVPAPSDLVVVGRLPLVAAGGLALLDPVCTPGAARSCTIGSTPFHLTRRAEPAGPLYVSLSSNGGGSASLAVYARAPVSDAPITGSADCLTAATIDPAGGRYSGDSTGLASSVRTSCDTATANPRAPTQIFKLVLPARRRVLLESSGSAFPTILALRAGASCPGLEVNDACDVGFSAARSFLDRVLDAGTYWVVLTGFGGAQGPWTLDVFTAAP